MSATIPWKIRAGRVEDHPFVYSSWMKEERPHHPWLRTNDYFGLMTPLVRALLAISELRIAHPLDDENQILGWACVDARDTPVLHYVYVKATFRHFGVCSDLLADVLAAPKRLTTIHPSRHPHARPHARLLAQFDYEPLRLVAPSHHEVQTHAARPD